MILFFMMNPGWLTGTLKIRNKITRPFNRLHGQGSVPVGLEALNKKLSQ
jgi:hypothetical protein